MFTFASEFFDVLDNLFINHLKTKQMAKKKRKPLTTEEVEKALVTKAFIFDSLVTITTFLDSVLEANLNKDVFSDDEFDELDALHSELYKFAHKIKPKELE